MTYTLTVIVGFSVLALLLWLRSKQRIEFTFVTSSKLTPVTVITVEISKGPKYKSRFEKLYISEPLTAGKSIPLTKLKKGEVVIGIQCVSALV